MKTKFPDEALNHNAYNGEQKPCDNGKPSISTCTKGDYHTLRLTCYQRISPMRILNIFQKANIGQDERQLVLKIIAAEPLLKMRKASRLLAFRDVERDTRCRHLTDHSYPL